MSVRRSNKDGDCSGNCLFSGLSRTPCQINSGYLVRGEYRDRGVRDLTILASGDGVIFTSVGSFTFAEAPGMDGYLGEDIALSDLATRYISFDIQSNYSTSGLAFGL